MMLTMQRLVGAAEIGEVLGGLSRQRVNQLSTKADFPAPVVELRMGKVWDLADIQQWAEQRGRTLAPLAAPDRDADDA
jgi:prophage regulatory protein